MKRARPCGRDSVDSSTSGLTEDARVVGDDPVGGLVRTKILVQASEAERAVVSKPARRANVPLIRDFVEAVRREGVSHCYSDLLSSPVIRCGKQCTASCFSDLQSTRWLINLSYLGDVPGCEAGTVSRRHWLNWRQANAVSAFGVLWAGELISALGTQNIVPVDSWLSRDVPLTPCGGHRGAAKPATTS